MKSTLSNESLLSLAGTYQLLARLWHDSVDQGLAEALHEEPVRTAFMSAGGSLPPLDREGLDDLAHDYCQLFIGPKNHLPPVQSVWADGTFQGTASTSMEMYLEVLGDAAHGFSRETPPAIVDHLGVQLEVMGTICKALSEELQLTRRESLESLGQQFFLGHLCWTSSLIARAAGQATTEFYGSLMALTGEFLDDQAVMWRTV